MQGSQPYHGNVVARIEENGEVRVFQAFLQVFQPLNHLISIIVGESYVRDKQQQT